MRLCGCGERQGCNRDSDGAHDSVEHECFSSANGGCFFSLPKYLRVEARVKWMVRELSRSVSPGQSCRLTGRRWGHYTELRMRRDVLVAAPDASRVRASIKPMPPRSMVGQSALNRSIGVRIPGGQPSFRVSPETSVRRLRTGSLPVVFSPALSTVSGGDV